MSKAELIKPTGSVINPKPTGSITNPQPVSTAGKTEAQLYEEGITYNEPGYTYNQAGVAYGGVYGAQDTKPLVSLAQIIRPTMHIGQGDNIVNIPGVVILDEAFNPILDETGQYILQE